MIKLCLHRRQKLPFSVLCSRFLPDATVRGYWTDGLGTLEVAILKPVTPEGCV